MQLLLLRHADAVPSASSDDARALSDKGRLQARRMGKFCREHGIKPDVILSSPFHRAEQTARLVGAELKCEVLLSAFLASGMTPAGALEALRSYQRFECVMIVGHEPDFSELVLALLGISEPDFFRFRKAMLVGLDLKSLHPGKAQLEYLIPSKLTM